MKFISYLIAPLFFIVITSCSSGNSQDSGLTYSGVIKPSGMTTYQYGTHTITTDDSFYALKSETIDLQDFEGESVTIKAKRIEGYPLEGGPEYLEVMQVSKK